MIGDLALSLARPLAIVWGALLVGYSFLRMGWAGRLAQFRVSRTKETARPMRGK